jgi:hypothetical protein
MRPFKSGLTRGPGSAQSGEKLGERRCLHPRKPMATANRRARTLRIGRREARTEANILMVRKAREGGGGDEKVVVG